jgi:hypothetical protein
MIARQSNGRKMSDGSEQEIREDADELIEVMIGISRTALERVEIALLRTAYFRTHLVAYDVPGLSP